MQNDLGYLWSTAQLYPGQRPDRYLRGVNSSQVESVKIFRRQTFELDDRPLGPGVYSDFEFDRCKCNLDPFISPRLPEDRAVVRNVKLVGCEIREPLLQNIIVEDSTIENLTTHSAYFIHGAVFKHVTLRGRFGSLIFDEYMPGGANEDVERLKFRKLFHHADEAYYEHVDWALGISEGNFYDCELRYVPGHLVRRDPETQVLVCREKLARHDLRRLRFPASALHISLQMFAESTLSSIVLVVGRRHPKFKQQLEELKQLRDLGIAEPD